MLTYPESKKNNLQYRNMYLPCTFFYPFSEPDIRCSSDCEKLVSKVPEETAAIHYWSGSWLPSGSR